MAGAYRFLAVLIAELSLTLAQLPQELSPGNAPNVNLQFDTPFSASGFPGFHEGYTEMPPANPLFPMRFGFPAFSDSLISRGLSPKPSSSETTAHNRPPILKINNPTLDYSRYQTDLDQPSPGVSSEQVPHPYFPNNLGFSSPLGIPSLPGLENPFVPTNIFDTRNVSNQPDMPTLPISFGLSNTFGIPLQVNAYNFNNFPGTIPRLSATYKPEENSGESFTQISDKDSEVPIEKTKTHVKEDFLNFRDNFYNFSPLPGFKSESNYQQVPGLYSAPSFAMTARNFKQIQPSLFPLGSPIVPGLSTEGRFPPFANAFPGTTIKSTLNNDFPAIPYFPRVQLHRSITASRNKNNFNSPIMMNPDKNMQGFHPYIPGLTFPPMLDFNNIGPTFPPPFNNLTPQESKNNKTKPQPMPGPFQLPPLGIPLENNFNSPIIMNPDKNIQGLHPYIPGWTFPPMLDFNNIGPTFPPPFNNLTPQESKNNKTKPQPMPGPFQLPPLGIPLENNFNSPIIMNPDKNIQGLHPYIPGWTFPPMLDFNNIGPTFPPPFNNLTPQESKKNKTKPQPMPGPFQLPPLGIPLENYFNSPIMMNPDKNIQGLHPYIPGLPFPPMLNFNNIGPTFPPPFNNLTPQESKKNKTKPQPNPGPSQLPPLGIPLENNFNSPIMMNPDKNMQSFYPYIPGLPLPPELDFNNIGQIFPPPLNDLMSKKNKTNKIKPQLMPDFFQLPYWGIPLEYSLNSPVDTKSEKNNPSFFLKSLGLPFPSELDLNSEVPMFKDVFHNKAPKKCLRIKKRSETKTTPQMMPGLFQLPPLGIPLENYSPIQPYGLGPWPLLPQDFFEHLNTVTPENTFSPFEVLHPPSNLPIIFPDLPAQFLHLKRPGMSKINTSNAGNSVVDCTTVEIPDTIVETEPEIGVNVPPTKPSTSKNIAPSTTVVTPPATTSVYSTTTSPSTVASTTTTTTTTTTTIPITTTIPTTTTTTPIPTTIPTTTIPTKTTTTPIPSTMAPTTTSVSTSTMEPTTQFVSPSTLAPTTSPSSTAAPTNTTRPPTTIYNLLTSTASLFSSNGIRNTTTAN